ncbi:MAG: PQQ-dependent dehydrogenase, methanol/ethanol family [Pseudomonadales bacterium]|jgi:PQQ-dependent dehydrogenase (methanol/ethanol family)|nr:PQQ-dependent dehydrogenase, methanol/ethanol family [Pseudomonadales bacterium]MDP7359632.1 PQQ-dependent dehydrogenase, methanol/ethanol family [Pseudomonadales bacterium]MDP7595939.1 PQQ-dependent dehydrogenase, methanol/ethanol family [Pseudomonadales bacterium]HJN50898.1 PQQ-dependent dehydrogenase, methanol/ethanol family [Pseudomonadales bacterium]
MQKVVGGLIAGVLVFFGVILVVFRGGLEPTTGPKGLAGDTDTERMAAHISRVTATVTRERIMAADDEPGNWLAHGRTYDEQRFSPLAQIDDQNVTDLGLAWHFDTGTTRGLEASPIVVDGIMYSTGSWSLVFANNAKTGELIWKYDPEVPKAWGANACCDVVNRGVALWRGRVYVGTLDGRLVALDAATGAVQWDVNTIDRGRPYTITGAPRVINGKVIIGNGGAEYGVRGYVTAYDANTGAESWRFYTVPGDPKQPFESAALANAADTWNGADWWVIGGGGTVWDSMAYDPQLNLLYIGVGNGTPWNRSVRSPGGGDNLYLSSIVALNADSGEYVWHYQTTPGDSWDYTATQHMILTELTVRGIERRVIMQAPKNGFFYVLDRETGEFLSAEPYVPVTWASHIDRETGRPVETDNARYQAENPLSLLSPEEQLATLQQMSQQEIEQTLHKPSPYGGHNWHPMSYSPITGLVYIPALDIPFAYGNEPAFRYEACRWNIAVDYMLNAPFEDKELAATLVGMVRGHISAWDPVNQQEVWRVQHAGSWNGGILSTAGNLVFQGTSHGRLVAYRADDGEELWSAAAQTGIIAPPVTYMVDGEQFVTVAAGWGGAFALASGASAEKLQQKSRGRILTFKLGGQDRLPSIVEDGPFPEPLTLSADEAEISQGKSMYHRYCGVCHGAGVLGGGVISDLRYTVAERHLVFEDIVLGGILKDLGMVSFADVLTKEDVRAIQSYVISRAHALKEELAQP